MVAQAPDAPIVAKGRKPNTPIPLAVKLRVKSLYLYEDLDHQNIAKQTNLTRQQVKDIIAREGYVDIKRERNLLLTKKHEERAQASQVAIVEAIAGQAEEIALKGLDRAREAVHSGAETAAKDFQSWTGGIRNLVNAVKLVRAKDGAMPEGQSLNFNLFFLAQGKSEPKTVEAVEVKQVTE